MSYILAYLLVLFCIAMSIYDFTHGFIMAGIILSMSGILLLIATKTR